MFNAGSFKELSSLSYSCPSSRLPYEFPGWDEHPKQYSPACRGWFQEQAERPNQNIYTSPYTFFSVVPKIGVSYCAPVRQQQGAAVKFKGAYCQDRVTRSELAHYFDLGESTASDFFLVFSEDEEYAKQGWDNWRGKNVSEESNIRKGIDTNEQHIVGLLKTYDPDSTRQVSNVTSLTVQENKARLYSGDFL